MITSEVGNICHKIKYNWTIPWNLRSTLFVMQKYHLVIFYHYHAHINCTTESMVNNCDNHCEKLDTYTAWIWSVTDYLLMVDLLNQKQGKSEGFVSCDRPSYLSQIGLKSSIFQPAVWSWNLMDVPEITKEYLFCATLSFLYHFVAIGEFKLELQSGNA